MIIDAGEQQSGSQLLQLLGPTPDQAPVITHQRYRSVADVISGPSVPKRTSQGVSWSMAAETRGPDST